MIPHNSDGSTDVLVRGRDQKLQPPISTEPMFAKPAPLSPADDATTLQLPRTDANRPVLDETLVMSRVDATQSPSAAEPPPSAAPAFAAPSFDATPRPAASKPEPAPEPPRLGLLFILLLSYASAVTLALIYLLWSRGVGDQQRHQLEDLRDPVDEQGTVRIYRRDADLPPGHVLTLGEVRRFGAIQVEPLRVTQGPIEFQHFSGDRRKKMPNSPPVLKLWLRFTNLSTSQKIAPLDALLLYKRQMNREGTMVANTFVCRTDAQASGPVVFSFPAALNSEWDMDDQSLGRELEPGESIDTYIPSDSDGLDQLSGQLVWRFQLRKGYAPTGRGVTTLVEVKFDAADVQSEQPAAAQSTALTSGAGVRPVKRCVTVPSNAGWPDSATQARLPSRASHSRDRLTTGTKLSTITTA